MINPMEFEDCLNEEGQIDGWWTKDDEDILISKMTDNHLKNAIAWIERHKDDINDAVDSAWMFASSCRGDMASYYSDQMVDDYEGLRAHFFSSLRIMKAVQESRLSHTGWDQV